MEIIRNLNKYPVTITWDGVTKTYQPDPDVTLECWVEYVVIGEVDGFPVKQAEVMGNLDDIPDEVDGVYLFVPRCVFEAMEGRRDLICGGRTIRDKRSGKVIACEGFSR